MHTRVKHFYVGVCGCGRAAVGGEGGAGATPYCAVLGRRLGAIDLGGKSSPNQVMTRSFETGNEYKSMAV